MYKTRAKKADALNMDDILEADSDMAWMNSLYDDNKDVDTLRKEMGMVWNRPDLPPGTKSMTATASSQEDESPKYIDKTYESIFQLPEEAADHHSAEDDADFNTWYIQYASQQLKDFSSSEIIENKHMFRALYD